MMKRIPIKIVSGGQTGVDRAALDVALELGFPCGGWCPKCRKAEDGIIPERYPLSETQSDDYSQRTEWNVRDSDGTLILCEGRLFGGTQFTKEVAERLRKPFLIVSPRAEEEAANLTIWIEHNAIRILNVAGPRESSFPGIYQIAYKFLHRALLM
jgi:hypothetical protein